EYKNDFVNPKAGGTVSIRKPVKFYTADGATRVNQDVEEGNTTISIDQRKHVSWAFKTQDLTLSIEQYSERYIKPAMITLANTMDATGYSLYKNLHMHVGAPGTTPDTYARVSPAARRMDEMAVPQDRRTLFLNPEAHHSIAGDQVGLQQQAMVSTAYKEAQIGRIAGMDAMSAQNIVSHTVGAYAGAPLVNGAGQTKAYGDTDDLDTSKKVRETDRQKLATDGWTGSLKAGDVITIAGVFAVNPVPGEGSTGKTVMPYLKEFVITQDVNAGTDLVISPAIITSGPYQTVSAAPADNAVITVKGTASTAYPQNLALHRNAFALVMCPLDMPDGAAFKARESYDGLSLRVVKDYDIDTDDDIIRIDALYGWKAVYPELGVRLTG
ncbi:MAG: P22 phage major capsid protein family protein, partial [Planctomycetota bacterium]